MESLLGRHSDKKSYREVRLLVGDKNSRERALACHLSCKLISSKELGRQAGSQTKLTAR